MLTVPQLRNRPGDVPLLAAHFGRAMAREMEWTGYPGFTRDALTILESYDWPGNVRELKNVVERSVYRHGDEERPIADVVIDPFASPFRPRPERSEERQEAISAPEAAPQQITAVTPIDIREAVDAFEKRLLAEALAANRHSQKETAEHLGLGYHQLRNRLKKHDLI